ncbi:threonine aldolase family protein [Helicovermis profundi]|uniref:Low specificity L-threonine aldolase n=1 Tax=Helicovermis profundi TaxID=3065157 RepID=A0AAU9ETR9_9FIRM|nr:low specificity L-threonine aldolase [Clostridia bacterium S502]
MKMFGSDNDSGVHSKILEAIVNCNKEHENPYGYDTYSEKAIKKFKEIFTEKANVFFVPNGTAANVVGLSSLLRPFEGVVCVDNAHINVDECGAFERFTGSKILTVPLRNGKISTEDITRLLLAKGDEHRTQPKVISISQVSESGTIYTSNEIKEIADFAHKNNMLLHVDGARISNAAAALDISFKEMIVDTGVDLLSFGGTKNGMMYGEAIISFNEEATKNLLFARKQGMQLISKMRYISAQFIAYLENDLWKKTASHANNMAKLLVDGVKEIKEIKIIDSPDANIIIATIPKEWIEPLQKKTYFYLLEEPTNLVRWVASFDTLESEINEFIDEIKRLAKN